MNAARSQNVETACTRVVQNASEFKHEARFTTWAYALARTSAGRLGVTTYLVPPIILMLSKNPLVDNYDLSKLKTM